MVNFHRMKAARGGFAVCQVFAVFVENGELAARSLGFAVFDAGGAMVGQLLATLAEAMAVLEQMAGQADEP